MHVLSKETKEKSNQLKSDIIQHLENCNNEITLKELILYLKIPRQRVVRTIELINIEGIYKIKVNRENKKNIILTLYKNETITR
jgi:hypothetical protein